MKPPIPDATRRLIGAHVPTVPHLEALVLAHGQPAQAWSAAGIADHLYIPRDTAAGVLADLVASGLLAWQDATAGAAHYAPRNAAADEAVRQLVELYARRVVDVTRLIHAHDGDDAQRLADAFRIGRKP